MKWLITDNEFSESLNNDGVWLYEILVDNGIICNDVSEMLFISSSTDYDIPNCPYCNYNDNVQYKTSSGQWKCKNCRCKYSITTRRYLDNSKLPLTHWFRFCWIIAEHKKANSCFIARDLGITQKSAWNMIATLKTAMNDNGHTFINSTIEFKDIWQIMKLLMGIKK